MSAYRFCVNNLESVLCQKLIWIHQKQVSVGLGMLVLEVIVAQIFARYCLHVYSYLMHYIF
jgi:hypothetical protein